MTVKMTVVVKPTGKEDPDTGADVILRIPEASVAVGDGQETVVNCAPGPAFTVRSGGQFVTVGGVVSVLVPAK